LPPQYLPQFRDGDALKEAAVYVPAGDQVTDQRPDIPFGARRGAIPLIGPDLPDELHMALADGVKGLHGVHGHSFLGRRLRAQGPGLRGSSSGAVVIRRWYPYECRASSATTQVS
jgi:hypothetical protein